jgi:hypothetical protein
LGYQHAAQRPLHTYDTEGDGDGTETAGVQPDALSLLRGLKDAQDDSIGGSGLPARSPRPRYFPDRDDGSAEATGV